MIDLPESRLVLPYMDFAKRSLWFIRMPITNQVGQTDQDSVHIFSEAGTVRKKHKKITPFNSLLFYLDKHT